MIDWLQARPRTTIAIFVSLAVIVGGILFYNNRPVSQTGRSVSWGAYGGSFFSANLIARENTRAVQYTSGNIVSDESPYTSLIPQPRTFSFMSTSTDNTEPLYINDADLESFFSSIKTSAQTQNPIPFDSESSLLLEDLYSLVPASSLPTSIKEKNTTDRAKRLYSYGNEVGSYLEAFEAHWSNNIQILRQFLEDKNDEGKVAKAREFAIALGNLGKNIASIEPVPEEARAIHDKLATHYIVLGEKLVSIIETHNDDELVAAIIAYNNEAEQFVKDYVALATLFSAAHVEFSEGDPGSVFVFKPAAAF